MVIFATQSVRQTKITQKIKSSYESEPMQVISRKRRQALGIFKGVFSLHKINQKRKCSIYQCTNCGSLKCVLH